MARRARRARRARGADDSRAVWTSHVKRAQRARHAADLCATAPDLRHTERRSGPFQPRDGIRRNQPTTAKTRRASTGSRTHTRTRQPRGTNARVPRDFCRSASSKREIGAGITKISRDRARPIVESRLDGQNGARDHAQTFQEVNSSPSRAPPWRNRGGSRRSAVLELQRPFSGPSRRPFSGDPQLVPKPFPIDSHALRGH